MTVAQKTTVSRLEHWARAKSLWIFPLVKVPVLSSARRLSRLQMIWSGGGCKVGVQCRARAG